MNNLFTVLLLCSIPFFGSSQSKVAHVNSQDVMAAMPSYKEAVQKLDEFQKEIGIELQVMADDFQKEYDEYLKERDDLTPVMRQIREEKLMKKQQALQEREQTAQGEVEAYSRELNAPIVANIELAIETVSKKNSCDYVFDKTAVMISNGLDLTEDVIKEVILLEGKTTAPPQENVKP